MVKKMLRLCGGRLPYRQVGIYAAFLTAGFMVLCLPVKNLSADEKPNLLPIGGFESGISANWDWSKYPGDMKVEFTRDTSIFKEGKQSAKLYAPDFDASGSIYTYFPDVQRPPKTAIKENTEYTISFWYRIADFLPDLSSVKINVSFNKSGGANGSAGKTTISFPEGNGTADWKKFTAKFKTGSETALCQFGIGISNVKGTLWIDDMQIFESGETPPAPEKPVTEKPKSEQPLDKKSFRVAFSPVPLTLTGKIDDPIWQKSEKIGPFLSASQGSPVTNQTGVYAVYDKNNLYVAFSSEVKDADKIESTAKERDGQVSDDECVELFVMQDPGNGIHIIINPNNVIYDAKISKSSYETMSGFVEDKTLNIPMKTATYRGKDFWNAEMSIPWKSIGVEPADGRKILINFARESAAGIKEYSTFSPLSGAFLQPAKFSYLSFTSGNAVIERSAKETKTNSYTVTRYKTSPQSIFSAEPGNFRTLSWYSGGIDADDAQKKKYSAEEWQKIQLEILNEIGESGFYGPSLPWVFNSFAWKGGSSLFTELYQKYGMRLLVFVENSSVPERALQKGAEQLIKNADREQSFGISVLDPIYVQIVIEDIQNYVKQYNNLPFVDFYEGRDEPFNGITGWYSLTKNPNSNLVKTADEEVKKNYGFGKFGIPDTYSVEYYNDKKNNPYRWIAFGRWTTDKYLASRKEIDKALHTLSPNVCYQPGNFNFINGVEFIDFSLIRDGGLDWFAGDPYASLIEANNFRGTYNHGFATKLLKDLSGCAHTKTIVQAFTYGGYTPSGNDVLEWSAQAVKNGADAVEFFDSSRPKFYLPDVYAAMLKVGKTLKSMHRISFPKADTAILYSYYSHASEGEGSNANEVYTAYSILGEGAGSWFDFISDTMIERAQTNLSKYKVIYVPRLEITRAEVVKKLNDYVKNGGVLVVTDPNALRTDIDAAPLTEFRAQWFGAPLVKSAEKIYISGKEFPIYRRHSGSAGTDNTFALSPSSQDKILVKYKDDSAAALERTIGKGKIILWGANPFVSDILKGNNDWTTYWKEFQKQNDCQTELPIWNFKFE